MKKWFQRIAPHQKSPCPMIELMDRLWNQGWKWPRQMSLQASSHFLCLEIETQTPANWILSVWEWSYWLVSVSGLLLRWNINQTIELWNDLFSYIEVIQVHLKSNGLHILLWMPYQSIVGVALVWSQMNVSFIFGKTSDNMLRLKKRQSSVGCWLSPLDLILNGDTTERLRWEGHKAELNN